MEDEDIRKAIKQVLKEEAPPRDTRITDIDLFFQVLPHILGGCAAGAAGAIDTRPAMQKAFLLAREAVGQACTMGICKPVTICSDGSQLSLLPTMAFTAPTAPGQQPMSNASVPGGGGMVAQYPMNGAAQGSDRQIPAGGMVAQYPMHAGQPQVYGAGGPIGQPMDGGTRAVMTRQFPMDPAVIANVAPQNFGPQPGTRQYVAQQPPPQYGPQPQGYPQQPQQPQAQYPQPQQTYVQPQAPQYPQQQAYVQPQAPTPPPQYAPPPGGFAPVVAPQGTPVGPVAGPIGIPGQFQVGQR
jgi:hypothetical protein